MCYLPAPREHVEEWQPGAELLGKCGPDILGGRDPSLLRRIELPVSRLPSHRSSRTQHTGDGLREGSTQEHLDRLSNISHGLWPVTPCDGDQE